MSDFPECLMPRHEYEDAAGRMYGQNGQRCHRIQFHDGNCIFDRPPEFEPPPEPRLNRDQALLDWIARMESVPAGEE